MTLQKLSAGSGYEYLNRQAFNARIEEHRTARPIGQQRPRKGTDHEDTRKRA